MFIFPPWKVGVFGSENSRRMGHKGKEGFFPQNVIYKIFSGRYSECKPFIFPVLIKNNFMICNCWWDTHVSNAVAHIHDLLLFLVLKFNARWSCHWICSHYLAADGRVKFRVEHEFEVLSSCHNVMSIGYQVQACHPATHWISSCLLSLQLSGYTLYIGNC